MTVSSSTNKDTYSGNGSTTVFSYTFRILDDDEILVQIKSSAGVITTKTKTTHYTVSGVGDASGGSITMLTAPASGETLILKRNVPQTQTTDYVENDALPADTLEQDLDRSVMRDQQMQEELDRALKIDSAVSGVDVTLPTPAADKFLKWDSAGTALENADDTSVIGGLAKTDGNFYVGDGTTIVAESGATARASLGLGSIATQAANSVAITGGSVTGITDITVADGGTGASTAAGARSNLGAIADIVEDTTPQLGGNLDVNGNKIVSTSNGNIDIEPNGTGNVLLGNMTFDADQSIGAGQDDYVLTYDNGTGLISLEAASGGGASAATQAEQEAASSTTVYTSPGRQHYHPSAAKCWGSITLSAGTPTLAYNYNITGIADNGAGDFTVTIATDFSHADYAVVFGTREDGFNSGDFATIRDGTSVAVGSFRISCLNDANTLADPSRVFFACFGDQ